MGKLKRKGVVTSIIRGVLDVVKVTPFVAPFTTAIDAVKDNIKSEEGGQGKVDYIRIAISLGIIISVLAFVFGKISIDDLKFVVQLIY